jgi:hypothetical protein
MVDEDVEPAEGVERTLHRPPGALELGDVLGVRDRLAACRLDLRDDLVAGALSSGSPVSDEPRSLTTARAPAAASARACARPRPRPAPVTIAVPPLEQHHEILSIRVAVPSPPPQHIVTSPSRVSVRSSSWRSVVIRRAPVEPSG